MVIYIYHFLLFKKPKENDIKYKYQDFYASAKGQVSVRRRPFPYIREELRCQPSSGDVSCSVAVSAHKAEKEC